MANYCCATRTNYFHVNDADKFKKFMKKVGVTEDRLEVWEEKDADGKAVFGFGCYGSICGVPVCDSEGVEEEYCDYDYDSFVDGLAELVADDDAVIILESGNEKLRYVVGTAMVITSRHSEFLEIDALAAQTASRLLNDPKWKTRITY